MLMDAYHSSIATDHGWYAIYETEGGGKIAVTTVVAVGKTPGSSWPDLKYVGKVTKWIESIDESEDGYWDRLYDEDMALAREEEEYGDEEEYYV